MLFKKLVPGDHIASLCFRALYAAEPFFNQQQTTCIAENDSVGSREIAPIEVQSVKNKTETRAPGTITAVSNNFKFV